MSHGLNTSHGENLSGMITQFFRHDKDVARGKVMGGGISPCQNLFGAMDKIWHAIYHHAKIYLAQWIKFDHVIYHRDKIIWCDKQIKMA